MERNIYFVAHPEVVIDPKKEIASWPLSETGIGRAKEMLKQPWVKNIKSIFSSKEQKALDLAQIVADHLGFKVATLEELGEIDRSATGFIEPKYFWPVVENFYAKPMESSNGWEKAVDAQKRIVLAVERVVASAPKEGDIFIASHGAVGALLLSHLKKVGINMNDDLPKDKGGGYYLVFDAAEWRLIQPWKPIDEL